MAAADGGIGVSWAGWLQARLEARGWTAYELVKASRGRIASSQTTRWLRGGRTPDRDSIRAVCELLDAPVLDGLIAAGYITPDEARVRVLSRPADPRTLSRRALLAELDRRLPLDDAEPTPDAGGRLAVARDDTDVLQHVAARDMLGPPSRTH